MNKYFVNLYLKPTECVGENTIIVGDLHTKEQTAEKEGFGYYKKVATVSVHLSEEEYKSIME